MIDQCSVNLLPRLQQMPPRSPAPYRAPLEEWEYWKETQTNLKLELETVQADQFLSPLSHEEREQIRTIYLNAIDRCQKRMDSCLL
ncbi:MAG: hypothetical protein IKU72_01980 [Oscillospiraceae bacterium]|nr:hypothetical protein [Oscillospiraceae bacterium]